MPFILTLGGLWQQVRQIVIICYSLIQMLEPLETCEMLAFTKTIEAKSLSRAARELGTPRATVGRRLARLEERLGVRLLRRTTRALALTDAGEAFYRHARIVLDAVAQAEESVRKTDATVRGTLRVTIPPMIHPSLYALVCEFARSYPDVQVQINASARQVDLRREGYDVALRASTELEPGLVARTLTRGAVVAVASPAYLEARGTPKTVRDLRAHNCLLGFARDEQPQRYWPRATRSGSGKVQVDGSFVTNDISLLTEAAVRGLGIALLPIFLVGPLIERGVLVQVLKDVVRADTRVSAVYHEKEFIAPQVRAFVDALVAWAATGLKPPGMVERCNDTKGRNRHAPQTKKAAPKRVRPTRRLKAPSSSP